MFSLLLQVITFSSKGLAFKMKTEKIIGNTFAFDFV